LTAAAVAAIRPAAVRNNLRVVRRHAGGCRVLAVIKANAYGHGLLEVAGMLDGADAFAVARVEEAVQLREAGISKRLVVLGGFLDGDELECTVRLGLDTVVHSLAQVEMLEARPGSLPAVWLKMDTGMGRLGLAPGEVPVALARLRVQPGLPAAPVAMTHLACADEAADPATLEQLRLFGRLIGRWDGDVSMANSAAILQWPGALRPGPDCQWSGENWVRPGLMLYGASPLAGRSAAELGLEPAMSFETRLVSVRRVPRGSRIGYAGAWTAPRDSVVGVAAAGYADGYPWQLPAGTPVLVDGQRAGLVGRVSMDMIMIDLTGLREPAIGAPVVLWGPAPAPAVEEVAGAARTIPYTLLAGLNRRVALRIDGVGAAGQQPVAVRRAGGSA
jgi:alanine racemase